MNKTIFITGTSSGLGRASVRYFASQGWNVAATMRAPEHETELTQLPNVRVIKLDVSDQEQARQAAAEAIAAFGRVDVVLNNAGVGVYGALELAKTAEIDRIFQTNVRGVIYVIQSFLPHFREQQGGLFINVSSFMGLTTAMPLFSLYNMSKFALEGLTEALYYELKPFNIDLRLIEPGGSSDNQFVEKAVWTSSDEIHIYDETESSLKAMMSNPDKSQVDSTQDLVKVIAALANRESNAFRTVIGQAGKQLMDLRRQLPIEEYLEKMRSPA